MNESDNALRIEATVIGTLLQDSSRIGEVVAELSPSDFGQNMTRTIYEVICNLHFAGAPINAVTVLHELGDEWAAAIAEMHKSYSPLPCAFVAKITESNGVLSDNLTTDDWAFAYIFDLVVEAEYNGLRYHMSKVSGNTRYFYAITVEDGAAVIHELTRTSSKSTVTWAHRTVSSIGGGSVVPGDIETVEAQLVDLPDKLSDLTNDAGYLTTDTLPKYDGGVSAT